MRVLSPVLLALMTACGAVETSDVQDIDADSGPRIEAASPLSVVIVNVASKDDPRARQLAEAHCRKFDEKAQLPRMIGVNLVLYQCLPLAG